MSDDLIEYLEWRREGLGADAPHWRAAGVSSAENADAWFCAGVTSPADAALFIRHGMDDGDAGAWLDAHQVPVEEEGFPTFLPSGTAGAPYGGLLLDLVANGAVTLKPVALTGF